MQKDEIQFFDAKRWLLGDAPPEFLLEIVLRTLIIYLFLLMVVRLMGKRMTGQITLTELSVVITLGAIVSPVMQMPDKGIIYGLIALSTALAFHKGFTYLNVKSSGVEKLTQGDVSLIIADGEINMEELEKLHISKQQFRLANEHDYFYAEQISQETERSAIARCTGISKRPPEVIIQKIKEGKAVIAVTSNEKWVGFSYFEVWANGEFISNSGLIVHPAYRDQGVASKIKKKVFELGRSKFPYSKVFSITTGLSVMRMNTRLGFTPVTYDKLPKDEKFWEGCKSCVNYNILKSNSCKNCLCTAMLFDPKSNFKAA